MQNIPKYQQGGLSKRGKKTKLCPTIRSS